MGFLFLLSRMKGFMGNLTRQLPQREESAAQSQIYRISQSVWSLEGKYESFPAKGRLCFLDADYSQIELRVLAHMSGDQDLIDAYLNHQDIHRSTASKVFHTPYGEVTELQRRNAKAVNFGIVYGISAFGLSQDLNIPKKEAQEYIDQYFATYPAVKQFIDGLVSKAKEHGYSETMFGRKRPMPELASSNFVQRSFGSVWR